MSRLYKLLETRLADPGTAWHVVSTSDASYLQNRFPDQPIWALPVMMPTVLVTEEDASPSRVPPTGTLRILIYADLRQGHLRRAFLQFAAEVAQKIDRSLNVRFVVLGRVPDDASIAQSFSGLEYEVIEWADDYIAVIRSADIVVLPDLDGTGLKNRAIQSLALGCVVVGTSVAFEGIPVVHDRDALVCASFTEMRGQIELLADAPERMSTIRARAANFAAQHFSAESVGARWDRQLQLLAQPSSDRNSHAG